MRICVLGAGITGLSTAYQLLKHGFQVSVIDKEAAPALGASYANGGQLSLSNAIPLAYPGVVSHLLKNFFTQKYLYYRPHWSWHEWRWLYHFLRNCSAARADDNLSRLARICLRSRTLYSQLLEETGIACDFARNGILHFYFDHQAYQLALHQTDKLRNISPLIRQTVDTQQIVQLEPTLAAVADRIVGGFYSPEDCTGDAHLFCQGLAELCTRLGAEFLYRTNILDLSIRPRTVVVATERGDYRFEHVVCCIGAQAPLLLRKVGVFINLYPVKGYSITIPLEDEAARAAAPNRSLLDDHHKIVATRLGQRLRVAGIAELDAYNLTIEESKIELLKQWVGEILPTVPTQNITTWAGLRPTTPSNLPYVGASRHRRLWLNTGHGTLGWTAAMATAEELARKILNDSR